MSTLRQLLAAHESVLLLDAASARVQVGILGGGEGSGRWAESEEEAGVGIFRGIEEMGVDLSGVAAFVFCEGPGSVLGIRTVAMALRVWLTLAPRPVYAYRSLALVAEALGRDDVAVIADARRDSWHRCRRGGPMERVSTSALTRNPRDAGGVSKLDASAGRCGARPLSARGDFAAHRRCRLVSGDRCAGRFSA